MEQEARGEKKRRTKKVWYKPLISKPTTPCNELKGSNEQYS
jgi:hypothetical protein